ncbi:MAG: hypothetical protein NDJ90_01010 [Oligoflexia bacterium]|nr:hypothetical protein [Oligoflexia bacterium]
MKASLWSSMVFALVLVSGTAFAFADKRESESQGWSSYEEMMQPAPSRQVADHRAEPATKRELESQGWSGDEQVPQPGKKHSCH